MTTKQRIMDAALRLFGEQGFAGTSVAQIEGEAGLAPGRGGLYRHFRSKDQLLVHAVRSRLRDRGDWELLLSPDTRVDVIPERQDVDGRDAVDQLASLCQLGLQRLDHDRDISRLLMRDNSLDPEILEVFRTEEYEFFVTLVAKGLREMATKGVAYNDWQTPAVVIVGAIVHYWLVSDIFGGTHPLGIDQKQFSRAVATMIAGSLGLRSQHESTSANGGS